MNLPLLAEFDSGERVYLSNWEGGGNPAGAWSTITLTFVGPDGRETLRSYTADDSIGQMIKSIAASLNSKKRTKHAAGCGRPRVASSCFSCNEVFPSARERNLHFRNCPTRKQKLASHF